MRNRRVVAGASTALALAVVVSAQQTRKVELVDAKAGRVIGTIHVGSDALLLESGREAVLYTSEAMLRIDHGSKTYHEQTYAEMEAMATRAVKELSGVNAAASGVEYSLGPKTEAIAGCKAQQLIRTGPAGPDAVWLCKEWMPPAIRKAGERLAPIFPPDYWKKVGGQMGLTETMLMYGVPVRGETGGSRMFEARVTEGASPAGTFQIPAGYKKILAPK